MIHWKLCPKQVKTVIRQAIVHSDVLLGIYSDVLLNIYSEVLKKICALNFFSVDKI